MQALRERVRRQNLYVTLQSFWRSAWDEEITFETAITPSVPLSAAAQPTPAAPAHA